MVYGRVEPGGLRCMYHGWLFDACGKVVVRGDWLPEGEQRMLVGQPAYPCVEAGGVIFTYLGPGEAPTWVVHELFVKLPMRFALTKILRANVSPLDGARFVMPNLVFSRGRQA